MLKQIFISVCLACAALQCGLAHSEEISADEAIFKENFFVQRTDMGYDPVFSYNPNMHEDFSRTGTRTWRKEEEEGTLTLCRWVVREGLPFDLFFKVELRDPETGKSYAGEPIILTQGQTRNSTFTPVDPGAMARGREGDFSLEIILTPDPEAHAKYQSRQRLYNYEARFAKGPYSSKLYNTPLPEEWVGIAKGHMVRLRELGVSSPGECVLNNLFSKNPDVRRYPIEEIGKLGNRGKPLIPLLLHCFELPLEPTNPDYPTYGIGNGAATSLGQLHGINKDPLLGALSSPNEVVRAQAAWAITVDGGEWGVDPLIAAATGDFSPMVRRSAAGALIGHKKNDKVIEALWTVLRKESDASVRRSAVSSLQSGWITDKVVPPLRFALGDSDAWVREWAARGLHNYKDEAAMEVLITLATTDPEPQVRSASLLTLGRYEHERAVDAIIRELRDPDDGVRCVAAMSFTRNKDRRAIGPLIEALKDSYEQVVRNAEGSLQMITGKKLGTDPAVWHKEFEAELNATAR